MSLAQCYQVAVSALGITDPLGLVKCQGMSWCCFTCDTLTMLRTVLWDGDRFLKVSLPFWRSGVLQGSRAGMLQHELGVSQGTECNRPSQGKHSWWWIHVFHVHPGEEFPIPAGFQHCAVLPVQPLVLHPAPSTVCQSQPRAEPSVVAGNPSGAMLDSQQGGKSWEKHQDCLRPSCRATFAGEGHSTKPTE